MNIVSTVKSNLYYIYYIDFITSPLSHWVSSGCASFGYMQLPFPPTSLQSDSENDPVTLQDSGQQRFMSFAQLVHHFVDLEQVYVLQFFPDAFRHASESFALHKSEFLEINL